jgi:hypothetical protein
MMSPSGSGSSACTPAPIDPQLVEASQSMIRDARWNGIFMIETLRDGQGQPWFVELNGRAWGSMALARRMGFEYPAWAVRAELEPGFQPSPPPTSAPIVCRHLGRELVHLLIVMRGRPSAAFSRWPSRFQALRDVLRIGRRDRWYNLRRGAFRLFAYDTFRTVARAVRDVVRP